MDIEIWKPIPSYETLYEISNNGVVKSLRTGAVKCSSNNGKYKQVTKVASFDKDGNLINVYDSIVDASKDRKCDTSSITKCCKGKRKICNGLVWKYV